MEKGEIMQLIKGKSFYNKPWYGSYKSMIERCYREKNCNYKRYGGRGIEVCEEWHDIEKYEKWVLSSGYEEGMTIERNDVNGNYCPDNCRWASMKEQCNNRENTIFVSYNGETHSITEWAEITGINRSTLNNRYYRGDRGERLFRKVKNYG